ncbi:beta-ketoacyl-[acyl-carrier-protein] synthase family protein [Candidatus Sumerlaeota bacterium]|nr:beta-ketoacyl-[acyl-carrier-protein] synthase family protein [Candidatus Sumerlaeota bacterium]
MTTRQAIVTGLGCLCGAGRSVDASMATLYAGRRAPRPPKRFAVDLDEGYPVFEIDSDLDEEWEGLARADGFAGLALPRRVSRTSRLALLAASEACRQARVDTERLRSLRVGVCMGTTVGCTLNNEPFYRAWREGEAPDLEPVEQFLDNNPASMLARALGARGPAVTLANACSSGTDAVGMAKAWVESGRCDVAIAGGSDELSRVTYLGFISLMIASREPCLPFDRRRAGLNLGEGAGALIVETRESASARGARPLARVLGYGCAADAHHPTAPHPEGKGLRRAIAAALKQADRRADQVDFLNAHGTATPDNDRVEGRVAADVFRPAIPVVSTKAYTGHTLGAAGAIEAVFAIRALTDQRIPATAGFGEADPECRIEPTSRAIPLEAKVGISTSLAFGGHNSALVLERG